MDAKTLAVRKTGLEGLLELDLPVFGDSRGWFKENWQREKMVTLGLPDFKPVQDNISFNKFKGVTRGIHAEPWDKFISVASGKIFAAIVELRANENFGKVETFELTPEKAIYVPRGLGNSYQTLEDGVVYTYLVNNHWNPAVKYSAVNIADPELDINWPIALDRAEFSEKDHNNPSLAEFKKGLSKR